MWTREFSQEGLRPKGAHRQIDDREIERTEVLDIEEQETPKPEIKSGKGHRRVQRP
jgi:hypothetical protein